MDEIKRYMVTQNFQKLQADLDKIEAMPEAEDVKSGLRKANSAYQKPQTGIPAGDLANGVIPNVSQFITKTVSDLVNYYTKSQTYTKAEVQALIAAIPGFTYDRVDALPQPPSADTMWKLYLVPSQDPQARNVKDEFITVDNGESANPRYTWEQIGSTALDLSGYVTTEALNTALADYVTSDALSTALAGLNDVKYTQQSLTDSQKSQARTNIGATAPEVFVAIYGETTFDEVKAAYHAGKLCVCDRNGNYYIFAIWQGDDAPAYFSCGMTGRIFFLRVSPNNSWYNSSYIFQQTSEKSQSVETDKDSTAKYPSTKAVADAIVAGKQVFWAEYGVTTAAEIDQAVAGGKAVACYRDGSCYWYAGKESSYYWFFNIYASTIRRIYIYNGSWSTGWFNAQVTSNISQSIETDQASTTKYPSVKAVADALPVAMTDAQLDTLFDANWQ